MTHVRRLLLCLLLGGCSFQNPKISLYTAPAHSPPAHSPPSPSGEVVVKADDTLYSISRTHHSPLRALILRNHLAPPYTLHIGQRLVLPRHTTHSVKKGETLYHISRLYNVSLSGLVRINQLMAPYTLFIGQRLQLPETLILPPRETPVVVHKLRPQKAHKQRPTKRRPDTRRPDTRRPDTRRPDTRTHPSKKHLHLRTPSPPKESHTGTPHSSPPKRGGQQKKRNSRTHPHYIKPKKPTKHRLLTRSNKHGCRPQGSFKGFLWPVQGRISQRFGQQKNGLRNDGINISSPKGSPIRASAAGCVVYVGSKIRGFGILILIKHVKSYITSYAHVKRVFVHRGSTVHRGQMIALVGSTGNVTRPQLNFQIRKGRRILNPLRYLRR